VTIKSETIYKATTKGNFYPKLESIEIDFGESTLFHDDKVMQFFLRQGFSMMKYTVQSAINYFGVDMINWRLPYYFRDFIGDQMHLFEWNYPQLEKFGTFNLNWRLTANPHFSKEYVDLDFFFDIGPGESRCLIRHDDEEY